MPEQLNQDPNPSDTQNPNQAECSSFSQLSRRPVFTQYMNHLTRTLFPQLHQRRTLLMDRSISTPDSETATSSVSVISPMSQVVESSVLADNLPDLTPLRIRETTDSEMEVNQSAASSRRADQLVQYT